MPASCIIHFLEVIPGWLWGIIGLIALVVAVYVVCRGFDRLVFQLFIYFENVR